MSQCLLLLAFWILLSGIDDLFIAIVYLWRGRDPFPWPSDEDVKGAAERPVAILIPLWCEYLVIGQMLERNLSAIEYSNYEVFVGVYPNDPLTQRAVADVAEMYGNVHIVYTGCDGPTSKGDCLNWVYRGMERYEAQRGIRFEIIITHDAEDLVHPESVRLINWFSRRYAMVQIPVLPLSTPGEATHGLYCDEFAEYQSKDIPVRQRLGGFLPSNGVGTGFSREALERIASIRRGLVFDPECLTEDYENGFLLHALGYRQIFVPIRFDSAGPIATREYFPRTLRPAVRQRSRWVAGIALQGWQRHGWNVPWRQVYWFWRDRKGLAGNLISPAANILFLYELAFGPAIPQVRWICTATLALTAILIALRMNCAARVYGVRLAAGVPLRIVWGNLVNFLATVSALYQFARARVSRGDLKWHKTEHLYPAGNGRREGSPLLGQLLVSRLHLSEDALNEALRSKPQALRIGEYLAYSQKITEEYLYLALSLQSGIPFGMPSLHELNPGAVRALPREAILRWKVLPYRVAVGQLHVVTPELPTEKMVRDLGRYSGLAMRFRLVRPGEFEMLAERFGLLH